VAPCGNESWRNGRIAPHYARGVVLTIFSIPKSFEGVAGVQQLRAAVSWLALDVPIVLLGDEPGVAETANELSALHIGEVARNEDGTPHLDSAFRSVVEIAPAGIHCFVNSDIVLTKDLLAAVEAVRALPCFLLVGQSRDLSVTDVELGDPERLRQRALGEGRLRGPAAIDWFVFPTGLFDPLPPFVVGRAGFDNWMIWKARQLGPVIDATDAVVAIHQPHDYAHLSGGKDQAYYGEEARLNVALGGGKAHTYTLHDASHKMRADLSIHRNFGSILRTRETVRKIGWKLGLR
jgi:hypothetical protein